MSFPWALSAVLAAAAFVRLPMFVTNIGGFLTGKILWYDEAYSAYFAGRGLAEAIRLAGYDTTPGLYVVLLHFWRSFFGDGTPALASLSLLLSLAAVPLVYVLAKEFFGRRAGLLAAIFLALNPLHVKFATEVRTYNLLFCLSVLSLIFLRRFLSGRRPADGAGWMMFSVLGLYSHYTFLFFFLLQNLYILFRSRSGGSKELRLWVALLAAGAVACLPLPLSFRRWGDLFSSAGAASYFGRAFGHGDAFSFLTYFSSLFFGERQFYVESWPAAVISLVAGALAAVGSAAMVWRIRSRVGAAADVRQGAALFGWLLFGGILAFMAAGFIYDPRYYLIYVAPAAVLTGAFLAGLRSRTLAAVLVAFGLVMFLPVTGAFEVTPALAFKYYAPAFAEALERQEQPGDLILLDHFTDILFRRYYGGSSDVALFFPRGGANVTDMFERFRYFDYDLMTAEDEATLESLTAGRRRVWTIDYYPQRTSLQDPGGLKRRWFSRHYLLRQALEFPSGGDIEERQRTLLLLYEKE